MDEPDLAELLRDVDALRASVDADGAQIEARWHGWVEVEDFAPSAANLARYLAFRRRDLRRLQRCLMEAGLSSLGRAESRVTPTLEAVSALLAAAQGATWRPVPSEAFHAGERRIAARADLLLGAPSSHSPIRLLVTLPSEAADNADFVARLADLGVEAVRINCAHDDEAVWARMIAHVGRAPDPMGRRMRIMMDLAGPKIRTGESRDDKHLRRVAVGDELAIAAPGRLHAAPPATAAIECTLTEALRRIEPGQRILLDDGKLDLTVLRREEWGVVAKIVGGPREKGYKLKPEKGVNFPDTEIEVPALTDEDSEALRFVARHADGVGFSFVQDVEDVRLLQDALARERPDDWRRLGLLLKIETKRAVRNLPDLLVRAAGRQPTAVMIARGDLAVEIGFARLAEMQEEILWICEAAQIPAIWATQVLESLIKTGLSSRGEMTDAAMAARAECVMLNKGPFVFEGIAEIDRLIGRMSEHISKKTHQLRPLRSW